jgi:HK97 family phage prohead protease
MEPDFSGYATKAGLKCSDGRTITDGAFAHHNSKKVPLVWQHTHDDPTNVLGYAMLEHRDASHPEGAGLYCYGFFNGSEKGQQAKALVQHGDITALSIYANGLVEKARAGLKEVVHGIVREVSLVLSGANPGALIDTVGVQHADGSVETLEDEAVIYSGLENSVIDLSHDALEEDDEDDEDEDEDDEVDEEELQHAADDTVADVYNSLSQVQKDVVHFMIGAALEQAGSAQHSDNPEGNVLTHQEGNQDMKTQTRNAFDGNGTGTLTTKGAELRHAHFQAADLKSIVTEAQKLGSFKEAFIQHAEAYGITDIDLLFPDAKAASTQPELIVRRTEWVAGVIDGAKHTPFSRIKSLAADLTAEEARAKGYVKGNRKKDEVVKLLKRVTTPTTVYKKQKLDRDDIVDITDLDVVAWLKWEMRFMLEEELARAILIGDGREPDDEDKIDEDHLRPIAWDDEMYTTQVNIPTNATPDAIIEYVLRARKHYKGTGTPTFYTTEDILTDMLLVKDKIGRRLYLTEQDVAAALRVSKIVPVEVLENTPDVLGLIVNISDYTIGADKGGQLSMFDDFDIDYNQYKYLIETRISGCLTKPKSAVVVKRTSGTTVVPQAPAFDAETDTLTIPTVAGISYFNVTDPMSETEMADGSSTVITEPTDVEARADAGYNFAHNTDTDWTYAPTGA